MNPCRVLTMTVACIGLLMTPSPAFSQVSGTGGAVIGQDGQKGVVAVSTNTTPGNPGGSAGAGGASPNRGGPIRVSAPLPECRYVPYLTGPQMASFIGPILNPPPRDQIQAHATDLEGRWYAPRCEFTNGTLSSADTLERIGYAYARDNPMRWFTSPPPPPAVPVAALVELARDGQQIPDPVVQLNPATLTVTGLRTWIWPTTASVEPVVARAESGPNWAEVTATPGKLVLSAPGADVGPCDDPKVWSAGQPEDATDCYVTFRRSSAGMPDNKATISAAVVWSVVLTTSDGVDNGPIGTVERAGQVSIGVAEIQSVLR